MRNFILCISLMPCIDLCFKGVLMILFENEVPQRCRSRDVDRGQVF